MKRMTYFVMALALVLGFTQCKKEKTEPQGEQVTITLDVNKSNNGSRVNVEGSDVTFTQGDQILVASNGHYVGTLIHNGTNFSGDITDPTIGQPLYFYFLGNNAVLDEPVDDEIKGCTVNISDQTGYPALPVISFSESNRVFDGAGSYSAVLQNKCSLMKFKVTTTSTAPICITGMNNQVTVTFDDRSENDGFSYGKADAEGVIKLKGGSGTNVEKWAIVLKHDAYTEAGIGGTVYTEDISFVGCRPVLPAIDMDEYFDDGIAFTVSEDPIIDLSGISENITVGNHRTLTGALPSGKYISIASDATVTLNNVTINNAGFVYSINCLGNAKLILSGNNSITVNQRAAIQAPPTGSTLVIESDPDNPGTLTAYSEYYRAIGGATEPVGNITINGGTITATGGIGSYSSSCGDITINGGAVNVPGVMRECAAIGSGSGQSASCGNIIINGGTVTATNQTTNNVQAGAGIGSGVGGACGTITINGGTVTAKGGGRNSGSVGGAAAIGCGYQGNCSGIVIGNGITQIVATVVPNHGKRFGASTDINNGTFGGLTIGSNYFGNKEPTKTGDIDNSNLKVSVHSYYSMTIVPR